MKKKAHSIDILFMLVLFSVFAVMSVMLILIGSNVYGKIIASQDKNGNNQTILSYITNKVRVCQLDNGIFVEEKDGTKVLVVKTAVENEVYEMLIYEVDGKLKEATISEGDDYTLDFGDVLAEVSDFDISMDNLTGLLTITVGSEGNIRSVDVYTGIR